MAASSGGVCIKGTLLPGSKESDRELLRSVLPIVLSAFACNELSAIDNFENVLT